MKTIDMSHKDRISFENSQVETVITDTLHIFNQKIKNMVKLYSDFCFMRKFIAVAHSNILSILNFINAPKWRYNIAFDSEITNIFTLLWIKENG
jgi:hypothetical protein